MDIEAAVTSFGTMGRERANTGTVSFDGAVPADGFVPFDTKVIGLVEVTDMVISAHPEVVVRWDPSRQAFQVEDLDPEPVEDDDDVEGEDVVPLSLHGVTVTFTAMGH